MATSNEPEIARVQFFSTQSKTIESRSTIDVEESEIVSMDWAHDGSLLVAGCVGGTVCLCSPTSDRITWNVSGDPQGRPNVCFADDDGSCNASQPSLDLLDVRLVHDRAPMHEHELDHCDTTQSDQFILALEQRIHKELERRTLDDRVSHTLVNALGTIRATNFVATASHIHQSRENLAQERHHGVTRRPGAHKLRETRFVLIHWEISTEKGLERRQ